MFTGLVQKLGSVRRVSRGAGLVLEIASDTPWAQPLEDGESIAVNGVCLTVVAHDRDRRFTADVLGETESRTTLAGLVPGDKVNLERALRAGDAMGGHIVQGHVDCVGVVASLEPKGRDFRLRVRCGRVFAGSAVLKGSVAVDGVSLTISALGDDWVGVDVIPTTAAETTIGRLRVGGRVNLEGDVIGKYIARKTPSGGLSEASLAAAGFI